MRLIGFELANSDVVKIVLINSNPPRNPHVLGVEHSVIPPV